VGHHEAHGVNDVRCGAKQHFALSQRFGNQAEFVMLEVAQSAVDQLAARRARRATEVTPFDKGHREAAARRITRDPRAIDAAADYEDIDAVWQNGWHGGSRGL
jgi:hypothetical protein